MDDTTRLSRTIGASSRRDIVDDDCSTDSGCSSRGSNGSNGSDERLSRRGSTEHLCRRHQQPQPSSTRSHERLSTKDEASHRNRRTKSSRSWSPSEERGERRHHSTSSPSPSSSQSDGQSSCSDSCSRPVPTKVIKRALQRIQIAMCQETGSSAKEKKQMKKTPQRILRDPVPVRYAKGPSGLNTQRVPYKVVQNVMMPCSCKASIGLYR